MNNGFLNNTAAAIIEKHGWHNMDDLTLVFPSRRAGVVFKDILKQYKEEHHAGAILLPAITTLPDLFDSLCPMATIEELEAVFRLYGIYAKATQDFYKDEKQQFEAKNPGKKYDEVKPFNLDVFYSWGRQLLTDFNNIDSSDAAKTPELVHQFFDNAIQAKNLEGLKIDDDVRERLQTLLHEGESASEASQDAIRKKYEAIWRCMESIYNAFHAELAQVNKVTTGMQKRWVVAHWDEVKEQCAGQQYIFIGFNYLLPVEKDLFALLQQTNENTCFYWDYVQGFQTNHKAYSFIEQNMEQFPNAAEPAQWTQKQVEIVAASSANSQAQYVAPWLRQHYTEKGQRTAVVICDEQMLEPVIYALPSLQIGNDPAEVNINITKGFPISSTQIYSDVIAYLSEKKNDRCEGETYSAVVQRVLDEVVEPADKKYRDYIAAKKIQAAQPKDAEEGKDTAESWQTLLIKESIYQVQLQLNQLHTMLSNPAYERLVSSLTLLRSIVRRCMESVSLPFHGEPITDIQVMGVLETRALDFDNLLLLNVEEGVVPRKESDSSFIPYYLRKWFRMQTREEAASVYAYNFFRLLSRATHITAVFSNAQTRMGAKSMSRFLMQIMTSEEFGTARFVLQEGTNLPEPAEVTPNKNMLSRLNLHEDGYLYKEGYHYENGEKKPYSLSPSALNTYIACPRWFYLQYVEGLRTPDQSHAIFESNEMGTFVHKVMELIYKCEFGCEEFNNPPVQIDAAKLAALEQDEERLNGLLIDAYDAINAEAQGRNSAAPTDENKDKDANKENEQSQKYHYEEHPAENLVILKLVHKILQHDIEDARTRGLKRVALEYKKDCYYDVAIKSAAPDSTSCGTIQVGGTIDRLDICGGTLRVVDYKTGGYSQEKLDVKLEKLVEDSAQHYVLQTLIYSEAVASKCISTLPLQPNLFFTQSNLSNTALTLGGKPIADYNALRSETNIPALIREKISEVLLTKDFPQCKENGCKSYCPFFDICSREPEYIPQQN